MGQKTVRFSDLSGQLITEHDALARIVVHDHPELGDSPVEFEALTDEAKVIEKAALRVAIVELLSPARTSPAGSWSTPQPSTRWPPTRR